jgi:hypothetical protein
MPPVNSGIPAAGGGRVQNQSEPQNTPVIPDRGSPQKGFVPESGRTPTEKILDRLLPWVSQFPFDVPTVLVVFGPILFLLALECYRWRSRRMILQSETRKRPPHSWPIQVDGQPGSIYNSADFSAAARRLHSRKAADSHHFDVIASVGATAQSLGYPVLRWATDTRLSEYLILIDRTSTQDHQAALFAQLTDGLREQGLYVQRYFFDGDPRICWSMEGTASARLSDIQSKYRDHRLILLGEADRLVDSVTGGLVDWASIFFAWSERAVLTPLPASSWGARERALSNHFVVLPANTETLFALIDWYQGLNTREIQDKTSWVSGEFGPSVSESELVEGLRRYLGPEVFCWICACAVYPELHWDLTLHLGSLPCMPANLVTEPNLLGLIRVPWFRDGLIPDGIRYALIRQLSPEQDREVRETIVSLLQANPADEGTFAFERQVLEIAVNRSLLDRSRRQRRAIRGLLRQVSSSDSSRNYVVLRLLESMQSSPIDFLLPQKLRRGVYESGLSIFGMRTAARFAVTLAIVLIGLGGIALQKRATIMSLGPLPKVLKPKPVDKFEANWLVEEVRAAAEASARRQLKLNPPVVVAVGAERNQGVLRITTGETASDGVITQRSDVAVFVNGVKFRRATQNGRLILYMEPKVYKIRVEKEGFQPVAELSFEVKRGAETRADFVLVPLPQVGTVLVSHAPAGADVVMDGAPAGTVHSDGTLTLATLTPGEHTLTIKKGRYMTKNVFMAVAGRQANVDGGLRPAGTIKITIVPPDVPATLSWRLESSSYTYSRGPDWWATQQITEPHQLVVPEGTYTIVGHAPGHQDAQTTAKVTDGQVVNAVLIFSKIVAEKKEPVKPRAVGLEEPVKPVKPRTVGLEELEKAGGWARENGSMARIGGNIVVLPSTSGAGSYSFQALMMKGKRLEWVVNFVDARNYVGWEVSDDHIERYELVDGRKLNTAWPKLPVKLDQWIQVTIDVTANAISVTVKQDANNASDRIAREGPSLTPGQSFTRGRFGFRVPGKDKLVVGTFSFTPK